LEVSYGRYQVVFDAPARWTRMPAPAASYDVKRGLDFDTHRRYLAAAVAAADPDVDFSRTQLLVVISPPQAGIAESPAFIASAGWGIVADGNEMRFGTNLGDATRTRPEIPTWAVGMFVHEIGHTMGLPDLYGISTTGDIHRGVGQWDVMGYAFSTPHLLAWHKWKLGWLDDGQVTCLRSGRRQATLTPLEVKGGMKAVVVPTGRSTAIVAEYRARIGRDALRCDEGVLVYTVDTSKATGAFPIQVRSAQPEPPNQPCVAFAHAPFDLGRRENPTFTDKASRTTIRVVRKDSRSRTVVVTKS
jgi:M6 family metalloprotease-like protein